MQFATVFGVDFSGAKLAGRNTWIARLAPPTRPSRPAALLSVQPLERLAGTADCGPALAHLVARIASSEGALWALDFPFGFPVEVMEPGALWADQLAALRAWQADAYDFGLECLARAKRLGGPNHIRRQTDSDTRAPFDPYHYRIIYQTFHGMRDVLAPLTAVRNTAILPFHYRRLPRARRALVEACPSCTLKRLGLPHHNYKQPEGGPLTGKRRRTRHVILAGLTRHVKLTPTQRLVLMRNGGGDAIDAVLAAVGVVQVWAATDHRAIARHRRYPREGRLYV